LFCNLYQWMLHWWTNCLKKKTVYYLYQGMYRCTWFIGEITLKKMNEYMCLVYTDCKMFFFQRIISPIQHSLVQIVKMLGFSNSYFTNTTFFGTDCIFFSFQSIGEITVWKKTFYNLYQGMLYWWNNCLEKKNIFQSVPWNAVLVK
jgi:hypothetical protein